MRNLMILMVSILVLSSCKKEQICGEGYQGEDCTVQITPTKILIEKIVVNSWPTTSGGSSWDLTSRADLYPVLKKNGNTIWTSPTFYSDVSISTSYSYELGSSNISFTEVNERYLLELYDHDSGSADDFMQGVTFVPYQNNNGFPNTIKINAGDISADIHVRYVY